MFNWGVQKGLLLKHLEPMHLIVVSIWFVKHHIKWKEDLLLLVCERGIMFQWIRYAEGVSFLPKVYIEDITWPGGITNFVFECWKYSFSKQQNSAI